MKKLLLAALTIGIFATRSMAIEVLAGGAIPLINHVIGIGTMTLDFSSPATDNQIAYLIINNNSQTFDLTVTATNAGKFINADLAANNEVTMTTLSLGPITQGTLGDEAVAHAPVPLVLNGTGALAAGTITWNYDQETATVNYGLGIFASWLAFDGLAGLYTETFTCNIVATL